MRTEMSSENDLTFSPGLILAGTTVNFNKENFGGQAYGKDNIIAQEAMSTGDLRFLTSQQEANAKEKIKKIVSQHLSNTTATVSFQNGIPSMSPTTNNFELLKRYSEVNISLGYPPVKALDPGLRGAADISHIANIMQANLVDGLGPVGIGAHSVKETLDIKSFPIQTQKTAILMYRLTR